MRYGPNRAPEMTVTIFYDTKQGRASKTFTCPRKARSFYGTKFKTNKHPELKANKT